MAKHEKTVVDFNKPYEENEVGMRGIVYFGLGLFLLIVVTFGLMWALQNVMEDQKKAEDEASKKPMAMNDQERLPPPDQPRLQAAPGFGVNGPNGPINLELKAPQSEYRELHKQWEEEWKDGKTVTSEDGRTKTVMSLPIKKAKEEVLNENLKARTGNEAEKALIESRTFVSGSSAGRTRSDRRR